MRWHSILGAGLLALAAIASVATAHAQRPADESFLPAIVDRTDTISITTNEDPDIFPGLRPLPNERFSEECTDLKDAHAEEAKIIAKHAKSVARKGDPRRNSELQIKLAKGRTIRFFDYPCGESFTSYIFVDLLPQIGFALVVEHIYEDYSYIAASLNSGRVSKLLDKPVLSPDGKRFASYRYDMMNAVTELTLYTIKSDRVLNEAACEVIIGGSQTDATPVPKWSGAETLSFVVAETGKPFPDGPVLRRQGKDWVLEGPVTFTLEGRQKKPFRQVCQTFK